MNLKSYIGKEFKIISNEARIRRDDDITKSAIYQPGEPLLAGCSVGDPKIIPKRTQVKVSDVRADARKNTYVFINPLDGEPNTPSGWTMATNLEGGFLNETVGLVPASWALPPPGNHKTVTDKNAVIRDGGPSYASRGKTIPAGSFVLVLEASKDTKPAGRFVRICAGTIDSESFTEGAEIGWTAASNLSDGCSDIYGSAEWADRQGTNACWRSGKFIGQKLLVSIVGTGGELEQITVESLGPYMRLVEEAAKVNLAVGLESGFRTFAKQKALHDGFLAKKPGFNLAAKPGNSNHQHGQAFDFNTGGFDGTPVYDWLKRNGPALGFIRTVNKEHWHWEYMPDEAPAFVKAKRFKLDKVKV
ncbi:MAG: M15 family metallopeptidase [Acidobacteria bacterium]|nr:M15 family metallopeptidase [Acidobacteriota bacterium]